MNYCLKYFRVDFRWVGGWPDNLKNKANLSQRAHYLTMEYFPVNGVDESNYLTFWNVTGTRGQFLIIMTEMTGTSDNISSHA